MAAFSPENFPKLFAKFDPSPIFLQIFVLVFYGIRKNLGQLFEKRNME